MVNSSEEIGQRIVAASRCYVILTKFISIILLKETSIIIYKILKQLVVLYTYDL